MGGLCTASIIQKLVPNVCYRCICIVLATCYTNVWGLTYVLIRFVNLQLQIWICTLMPDQSLTTACHVAFLHLTLITNWKRNHLLPYNYWGKLIFTLSLTPGAGMQSSALCTLGKHSGTEQRTQSSLHLVTDRDPLKNNTHGPVRDISAYWPLGK